MSGLPFEGLTVLVTGNIAGLSRQGAQKAIVELGGKAVGSVSAKTGLVVPGDGAGISKMEKVRALDLHVMTPQEFLALHADPTSWDGTRPGVPVSVHDAAHTDDDPVESGPEDIAPGHPDWVPMGERHLVGKETSYPRRPDGQVLRQVRMWCIKDDCGHKWLADDLHARHSCPVEAGEVVEPVTTAPWVIDPYASVPMKTRSRV